MVRLPRGCPFAIDDMIADEIDSSILIERVQASNALFGESDRDST
jgi:hypothetical protein